MLEEIINKIFLYLEGSTNRIMKQHITNILSLDLTVVEALELNMNFGFIHYNHEEFKRDYT